MLKEREKELKLLGLALKSSDSSRLRRRHHREKSTFSMTAHKLPPTASSSHLPHHRALAIQNLEIIAAILPQILPCRKILNIVKVKFIKLILILIDRLTNFT